MVLVWVKFLVCASIVVVAGTKLSKYGDAIAEKTRLTGAWVGLLLLAAITAMPELVTGVSSVAIVHVPDLAVGVVLGSNLFNLLIIALLDILHRPVPLLAAASRSHILSAGLYAQIVAIAGVGIFIGNEVADWSIGWFGIFSLLLLLSYLISLGVIFRFGQGRQLDPMVGEVQKYTDMSLRRTYRNLAIAALFIIGASIWLASIGDEIAGVMGWEASFVGSLFLAIITSLPEVTVCIAALRLGAIDMAIANILGSNMFTTGIIIAASDLFYWQGSLLSSASMSLALAAAVAVLMTGIVILGILSRSSRQVFRVASWETPALIVLYVAGAYILFVS